MREKGSDSNLVENKKFATRNLVGKQNLFVVATMEMKIVRTRGYRVLQRGAFMET